MLSGVVEDWNANENDSDGMSSSSEEEEEEEEDNDYGGKANGKKKKKRKKKKRKKAKLTKQLRSKIASAIKRIKREIKVFEAAEPTSIVDVIKEGQDPARKVRRLTQALQANCLDIPLPFPDKVRLFPSLPRSFPSSLSI